VTSSDKQQIETATSPSSSPSSAGSSFGVRQAILVVLVAVSAVLLLAPPLVNVPAATWHGGGAVLLTITLCATGALPEFLSVLLFFFLCLLFRIASPDVVFSGFHSGAAWLVLGGIVLGQAVQSSGLGARIVNSAMARFHGGYATLIFSLMAIGFILAFFLPSATGRSVILTPIAATLAARVGFADDSKQRIGIILAVVLGATLPPFAILPANVPTLVMAGAAESIYGITFTYASFAALNLPVIGTLSFLIIFVLIVLFFGGPLTPVSAAPAATGLSRPERRLAIILLATVTFWATDFLHGIAPAWVALGAAVVCLLPRVGSLDARQFIRSANFGPWIFVAGVIGLGAVAADIGLVDLIAPQLIDTIPAGGFAAWLHIAALNSITSVMTTHPAAPALLTPLAAPIAEATGWSIESVLLSQVPTWAVFPFAYELPPLAVAIALGKIRPESIVKFLLAYFVIGAVTIIPLHYFWARALGYY